MLMDCFCEVVDIRFREAINVNEMNLVRRLNYSVII